MLALLANEFPKETESELRNKWNGEETEMECFQGSELVHVLAREADGRVKGFAKGFRMAFDDELYLDEVLVGEKDRGQKLIYHLNLALINACEANGNKIARERLQCVAGDKVVGKKSSGEPIVINLQTQVYAPMGVGKEWQVRKKGKFRGVGADRGAIMLFGTGAAAKKAAEAQVKTKPLPLGSFLTVHYGGYQESEDAFLAAAGTGAADAPATTDAAPADVEVEAEIAAHLHEEVVPEPPDRTRGGWVAKHFRHALCTALIPIMFLVGMTGDGILPESPYSKVGGNITCDAASLKHAQKKDRSVSTSMFRLLAWGVVKGNWGGAAVDYMMPGAMSAMRAFKLGVWRGKDSRENLERYFAPHVNQALELARRGLEFDGLVSLPPWYWVAQAPPAMAVGDSVLYTDAAGVLRNARILAVTPGNADDPAPSYTIKIRDGGERETEPSRLTKRQCQFRRVDRPVREKPGTVKNKWAEDEREELCQGIQVKLAVVVTGDGAMLQELTGTCGIAEDRADLFSSTSKTDMGLPLMIVARAPNETVLEVLERLHPACTEEGHECAWTIDITKHINKHSLNSQAQSLTREPEEVSKGHSGANATVGVFAEAEADGRTCIEKRYKDLHGCHYDHRAFVPGVNGDDADFMKSTSDEWTLIRVPVVPEHFGKEFAPLWDCQTYGRLEDEIGGCIMHGGMRTGEGTNTWMLQPIVQRYAAGKGKDREIIERVLNKGLKSNLDGWYRTMICLTADKKSVADFTLSGSDVKVMSQDLHPSNTTSEFMKAVRACYSELGEDADVARLDAWEEVLRHWAAAMTCGYLVKASDNDRETFSKEIRWCAHTQQLNECMLCCSPTVAPPDQVRDKEGDAEDRRFEVVRLAVLLDLPTTLSQIRIPADDITGDDGSSASAHEPVHATQQWLGERGSAHEVMDRGERASSQGGHGEACRASAQHGALAV